MGLNGRGYISVAQLIVYAFVLAVSGFLVYRHGIKKTQGWILLVAFAIIRIVGAILLIAEEESSHPSTGLIIATSVVQSTGLSPLILATTAFLITVGRGAGLVTDQWPISKVVHVLVAGGVILGVIAGEDATKPQDANLVSTFRKLSALIFFGVFLFLVGLHGYLWLNRSVLQPSRRTLLIAISSALIWLLLRLVYTLGSAFESSTDTTFNLLTGSTVVFLLLSVIPEFLTVATYLVAGILIPFSKGQQFDKIDSENASAYDLIDGRRENHDPLLHDPSRPYHDGRGEYVTPYDPHRAPGQREEPRNMGEYAPPSYPPST